MGKGSRHLTKLPTNSEVGNPNVFSVAGFAKMTLNSLSKETIESIAD